ncbi:MAG: hypothetical protein ACJASQ_000244 [Crocinitomicaceae bacterium]|jgi:hypothetical protein
MTDFLDTEEQLTETQIKELESKINFVFPIEFKIHLLKFNGGRCEPNTFSFEENGTITKSSVDWFLALYDGEFDNLEDYFNTYKIDEKRIPISFLPIAHDPGGNLICMNKTDNKIYFWNHDFEVDYSSSDDNDWSNIYLIAESLNEFISTLK